MDQSLPSSASRKAFARHHPLRDFAVIRAGLQTGDNEAFLRYWHEVAFDCIGFGYRSRHDAKQSHRKWFPHNKGGGFQKVVWKHGLCDFVGG